MFLQQLFEAIDKQHAAFCFGRMNPPTIGHGQLINTVANAAAGGDYFIFVSQTQDSKKNPLDYQTKIKFIKAMFPKHAGHVVQEAQLKTIMQIAHWLYAKGYRAVTFVAGSDRIEGFNELLNKYNGHGQEGDAGYYKFDTIKVVSSGDRDPDADGVEGVSASLAREAAKAGNLEAFAQATGAGKLAEPLYQAVRKGMLLEGQVSEAVDPRLLKYEIKGTKENGQSELFGTTTDFSGSAIKRAIELLNTTKRAVEVSTKGYDSQRKQMVTVNKVMIKPGDDVKSAVLKLKDNQSVDEGASGYIPKNKREAKDPRWSNALTVDVHPDTPNKNMKALGLI